MGARRSIRDTVMSLLTRARVVVLVAGLVQASAALAQGIDVWTVGVNNTRQGWNRFETVLKPATVPKLRKIREFVVDEKIDVSPLVVADRLYVFSMMNTAYIFDVNSGAELMKRQLAPPFDPADIVRRPPTPPAPDTRLTPAGRGVRRHGAARCADGQRSHEDPSRHPVPRRSFTTTRSRPLSGLRYAGVV
jgi:hypothetical protein